MLLALKKTHKEHLSLLFDQTNQVLIDFCKLALDFLLNGLNEKRYTVAATKLGVEQITIQNAVEGLVNLLLESCKNNLTQSDFRDSVITVGFNEDQVEILSQFYQSKQAEIIAVLPHFLVTSMHYTDLDWRFEVQVASRTVLKQVNPMITMALTLDEKADGLTGAQSTGNHQKHLLQTDIPNLVNMTQVLEQALAESRTQHFKRIQRSFKQ